MSRFGIRIDKQFFNFAAAHFLIFPDGTRETLHGHNYLVWIEAEGELMEGDVVLDFTVFKPIIKATCDFLDHRMLLPATSPFLDITEKDDEIHVTCGPERFIFPSRDVLLLEIPNTSSEELARWFGRELARRLSEDLPEARLEILRVNVQESPGQSAWCEERLQAAIRAAEE